MANMPEQKKYGWESKIQSLETLGFSYEQIEKNPVAVFEWFLNHPDDFAQLPAGQRDKILRIAESQAKPMREVDLMDPEADDIDWITTHFWIPELKGPIWLADYQKTMLRLALSKDENGLYNYSLIVWSDIKKSIKSTIAAAVALRRAFQLDWGSIKVIGNDQKQAQSRSYYYLTRAIRLHPQMQKMVEDGLIRVHQYKVFFDFNNTALEAIPVDPSGEAGGNDDHIVWTEAWSSKSKAAQTLWTEMVIPPQKFGSGLKWVETYAGYKGQAPILEPLYENNVKKKFLIHDKYPIYSNAHTLVMWNQEPRLPWQSAEYYQQQAIELEDAEFRRVHRNQWVSSTETFLPEMWWNDCYENLPPLTEDEPMILGVDAAVSGDCFAVVGVTKHPTKKGHYAARVCRTWIPPKNGKLSFKHPDPNINANLPDGYITELCRRYKVKMIVYDAYQLHSMATEHNYERKSAFWEDFSQGTQRLEADSGLLQMIREETVAHPGFKDLTEHVLNADSQKDTKNDSKLRLVKSTRSKKIDAAVALSMALYRAKTLNL